MWQPQKAKQTVSPQIKLSSLFHILILKSILTIAQIQRKYLKRLYVYHILVWSDSTLCSSLNVKKVFARDKHDISKLSDCNRIQTHNHSVRKQTLNPVPSYVVWKKKLIFVVN